MGSEATFLPPITASTDVEIYFERLQQHFIARSISQAKQLPTLLCFIGEEAYVNLRNMCLPGKVTDKSIEQVQTLLIQFYNPQKSETVYRLQFQRRVQGDKEGVTEFFNALKQLSAKCNFQDLEMRLKDQIIFGLKNDQLRKKLLTNREMSYTDVISNALAFEAALKDAAEVMQTPTETEVNKVSKPWKRQTSGSSYQCLSCGGQNHSRAECRFRDATCHKCSKKGHIARACKGKESTSTPQSTHNGPPAHFRSRDAASRKTVVRQVDEVNSNSSGDPIKINVCVNDINISFELDTGSKVTLMPESLFKKLFPSVKLSKTSTILKSFSGDLVHPIGEFLSNVEFQHSVKKLCVIVTPGFGPCLLGRTWIKELNIKIDNLFNVTCKTPTLPEIVSDHPKLFADSLGRYKGDPININVQQGSEPKFARHRNIPFSIREKVENELLAMEKEGTVKKVDSAKYASPIVPVQKKNGRIRICADYKNSINKCIVEDKYPLPNIEDVIARIGPAKIFSAIDLSQAYLQIPISEQTKEILTINTHIGLYQYNCLPYGISSAPSIFQRILENMFKGSKNVISYLDDIVIFSNSVDEHKVHLQNALKIIENSGFTLNKEKCSFFQTEINYLGFNLTSKGVHPQENKCRAIWDAPKPGNVSELKSFLGLLNYYNKFIPKFTDIIFPLNELLKKDKKWNWDNIHDSAFQKAKQLITPESTLIRYNPNLPLILETDASPHGISAILSHRVNNELVPICFSSRSLSPAQRNYSQFDREGLAVIFGVSKFHYYLAGRDFEIITDNLPLTQLLKHDKQFPVQSSPRLLRWAIKLSHYKYTIVHRKAEKHAHVDCLSRMPLNELFTEDNTIINSNYLESTEAITRTEIQKEAAKDSLLTQVALYLKHGWPKSVNKGNEIFPYFLRRNQMCLIDGLVHWGGRLCIPETIKHRFLKELHATHSGEAKTKSLARFYIWYDSLDKDIENMCKSCTVCQEAGPNPTSVPTHPWSHASRPFERIHIDFLGPLENKNIFVISDAYSKFPFAFLVNSTNTEAVLKIFTSVFSLFGFPESIVSDNGVQFASGKFANYCAFYNIKHIRTAIYTPSTNGGAERLVQNIKRYLKKINLINDEELQKYLHFYRNTPHSTTNRCPSELFLGRRVRMRMDSIFTKRDTEIRQRQNEQAAKTLSGKSFNVGDLVWVRNFKGRKRWVSATVEHSSERNYEVNVNGEIWRRHINQIKQRVEPKDVQQRPTRTRSSLHN